MIKFPFGHRQYANIIVHQTISDVADCISLGDIAFISATSWGGQIGGCVRVTGEMDHGFGKSMEIVDVNVFNYILNLLISWKELGSKNLWNMPWQSDVSWHRHRRRAATLWLIKQLNSLPWWKQGHLGRIMIMRYLSEMHMYLHHAICFPRFFFYATEVV